MSPPVFRFAPSPNGRLHLGHALSALLNADMAAKAGGRLLLRIEDIDVARSRSEFEAAILDDLAWLGVDWERPVRRQSDHFEDYRRVLARLVDEGLVYPSFLSRGEIRAKIADAEASGSPWPRDPEGAPLHPPLERTLSRRERAARMAAGVPYALRLDVDAAIARLGRPLTWTETGAGPSGETATVVADPAAWGDVVIARRDVPASYHLAVVHDDALQGVSDVVRGRDLFHATSVHRLLQDLLGLPAPRYHHHRLVLGPDGRKLSKSIGSAALDTLRSQGWSAEDVRAKLDLPPL